MAGAIDGARPAEGVRDLQINTRPIQATVLAVRAAHSIEQPPAEVYARGGDLIATHAATDDWPFRTQLQWTAVDLAEIGAALITITVSLQTDLLDTRPAIDLVTDSPMPCRIQRQPARGPRLVWRDDQQGAAAFAAAPYPSDLAETSLHASEGVGQLRFAPPFLEKGVIRRCRAGVVLLAGNGDADAAIEAGMNAFAELSVPLTA